MTDFVTQAIVQPKIDDQAGAGLNRVAEAADRAADAVERVEKESQKASAALTGTRESVDRLWTSLDKNVAALQRHQRETERVNDFERQGLLLGGEKQALLDALARRYADTGREIDAAGRKAGEFNEYFRLASLGARAFGVSLTAAGIYTLGRRMMESTEEGKAALSDLGGAFKDLSSSVEPVTIGIVRGMGAVARSIAAVARGARDAIEDMKSAGTASDILNRESASSGFVPPNVDITGPVSVLSGVPITPGVSSFRGATARQLAAESAERTKAATEAAAALAELDETDEFFHREKMKRLHEEAEESRRVRTEMVRDEEQAMRALDETDRFLAAERMRRFHDETEAQKRGAADLARQGSANIRALGNDFVRFIGALGIGSGGGNASLGQGLGLLFSSLDNTNLSGRSFAGLFGARAPANDGIPDVAMTPQVFGSNPGGFMNSGMLAKAAPFLSSGMQGFQMGSVFGQVTGGNATNAGIGGGLGGMAGMAIGGPAGALIGSALGGMIGGLFGPKSPSNYTAVANFGGGFDVTSMGGDKPNQNTTGLAGNAAAQVEAAIAQLKGYGLGFSRGLDFLAIGEQRNSYFRLAGDTSNRSVGSIGDAGDLSFQVIKAMLGNAQGGSSSLRTALGGASSMADLGARAEFVTKIYETAITGAPALTSFETEMKALIDAFKDGAEKSREYGLSVKSFTEGFGRSFDENVRMQLLSIQKPLEYSLELWRRDAQARLDAAATVGGNLGQVRDLNSALFRQMNAPAISALTGLQSSIGYGSFSAAAPGDQYFSALSAFNSAKSSGDPMAFVSAAQNLLPIARNFLGTSTAYGDLARDVSSTASQLINRLSTPPDLESVTMAINLSGAAMVQAVSDGTAEIRALREEQQRQNGVLLALMRRVA